MTPSFPSREVWLSMQPDERTSYLNGLTAADSYNYVLRLYRDVGVTPETLRALADDLENESRRP